MTDERERSRPVFATPLEASAWVAGQESTKWFKVAAALLAVAEELRALEIANFLARQEVVDLRRAEQMPALQPIGKAIAKRRRTA